jgi:hypothetical protein
VKGTPNHVSGASSAIGEGEIDVNVSQGQQVRAVVPEHMRVRHVGEREFGSGDHLTADVDGVYLAKDFGEGARDAAGAAADFESGHLLRVPALKHIAGIGQDFVFDIAAAGLEKRCRPVAFASIL